MDIVSLLVFLLFKAMDIYIWILIAGIVMSWLIAFNVLNGNNKFVRDLYALLNRIIEPVLQPIRRFVPAIGGIDISPIILIFGFHLIQQVIIRFLMA